MPAGSEFLSVLRLSKVIQALQDVRDMPRDLVFLRRTPLIPALDSEIIGRWIGRVLIADLIADDAAAAVYGAGKMQFEAYEVPNIKMGRHFTQAQLNQLNAMRRDQAPGEAGFLQFVGPTVDSILNGLRMRLEALIVGMYIDQLTYDRLGFKATGISWGMPSDLKITVAIPWTDAANATPVTDILAAKLTAQVRYGIRYNRMDMSTQAFRYMIATTEFQNKAKVVIPQTLSFANFSLLNLEQQRSFASSVLDVQEINLYDSRYWTQDTAGNISSAPYLPINVVCLSDRNNDQNADVMDFANGIVTESMLMDFAPAGVIGAGGFNRQGERGPISYATVPPDLNSPNLTLWGVMRGFPRKFMLQATAALTVGAFTDLIPVTEPFG
jgi:hypothetical protein